MKRIAVIFGGESVEHDVSILTGLQFLDALDSAQYDGFPVYVDPKGRWWGGEALRERSFYPLNPGKAGRLSRLQLPLEAVRGETPFFAEARKGLFGGGAKVPFDLAVPAIHGSNGEDGTLQGLLELLGIPFAGSPTLGSAATMDKDFTKRTLKGLGIPVLEHVLVAKPEPGHPHEPNAVRAKVTAAFGKNPFPLIVKPNRLGSSIGVTKADDFDEVAAALTLCFRLDYEALIEPFVPNLAEYNVAVSRAFGELCASVIERPLKASAFLAFKDKYLSAGEGGAKLKTGPSDGMASLNRVLDPPELDNKKRETIRACARQAFEAFKLAGSVRVDFLSDEKTGKLWLNEINTVPGSFAFYLWAASQPRASFTELASALIAEGFARARLTHRDTDRLVGGGIIFKE
jgi:D-alanine-D-alanine ligase